MEDVFAGSGGDSVIKSAERCFVGGSSRSVANGEDDTTTCVGDARASTGASYTERGSVGVIDHK